MAGVAVYRIVASSILAVVLVGCRTSPPAEAETPAAPQAPAAQPHGAPLFDNLGDYSRRASTKSRRAQRYFDQGMVLAYGFNHAEAARSFREALRLDPACAICAWGVALVLGPNINLPMMDSDVAEAYAMAHEALQLSSGASPVERALIEALIERYGDEPIADRSALDLAYADAMREVAQRFPGDADVLALFAESLLDLNPWNYWMPGGQPRPATSEALAALKRAMTLAPRHPGALHYYIHTVEEPAPQRAERAADKLRDLVPGAGHLVHMPSHIYIRVGRYHDALTANIRAGEVDTAYIEACKVQGFYALGYHPHNWHFVWAAATFAGNREQALLGAEKTAHIMHGQPPDHPMFGPVVQHFALTPTYVAARFGLWDRVLSLSLPEDGPPYPRAIHHYARGLAHGGKGDLESAQRELEMLRELANDPALVTTQVSVRNNAQAIVAVAERVLTGDIAVRRKQYDAALDALREGVQREDALGYNEPEDWHYPVRQLLGAVLLEAGKPLQAEVAFRADLIKHPENGWSLFGLAQSLDAQGRTAEAQDARARFRAAWRYADIELTSAVVR